MNSCQEVREPVAEVAVSIVATFCGKKRKKTRTEKKNTKCESLRNLGFRMADLAISPCYRNIDNVIAYWTTFVNGQIEPNSNKSAIVLENLEMGLF